MIPWCLYGLSLNSSSHPFCATFVTALRSLIRMGYSVGSGIQWPFRVRGKKVHWLDVSVIRQEAWL